MPGPAFLRGNGVALHVVSEDDHEFLQRNWNDPAVRRSMPRVHPQRREETRAEYGLLATE
jgi:hypothetical protein